MKKRILGLTIVVALAIGPATPALAVVHPVTPSYECAGHDDAGGRAAFQNGGIGPGNPAEVTAPVPASNPGASTGTGIGGSVPDACE